MYPSIYLLQRQVLPYDGRYMFPSWFWLHSEAQQCCTVVVGTEEKQASFAYTNRVKEKHLLSFFPIMLKNVKIFS